MRRGTAGAAFPACGNVFEARMNARLSSPSTARNREPILDVLRRVLPADARVLELASGAGEHAMFFAAAMPGVTWRPSDPDPAARASIGAWQVDGPANLMPPAAIDVRDPHWGVEGDAPFDALVAINMIHISPWDATLGLMEGAGRLLHEEGVLFTYGPYKREGRHTAPSNEAFDESLRLRNSSWGVRDVANVARAANAHGLVLDETVEMPANNLSLIFRLRRSAEP